MKTRLMLALAVAAMAIAPARAQTAADETPIRAIIETALPERINAADARGVAALWSEKGTHGGLIAGARLREGRESIQQMWATGFSQPSRDPARTLAVSVSSIHFLRPDVAAVDARNTYHGGQTATGTPRPDTGELLFAVLTRENGAWTIASLRVVPLISSAPR